MALVGDVHSPDCGVDDDAGCRRVSERSSGLHLHDNDASTRGRSEDVVGAVQHRDLDQFIFVRNSDQRSVFKSSNVVALRRFF